MRRSIRALQLMIVLSVLRLTNSVAGPLQAQGIAVGNVVLTDDFSNQNSGWDVSTHSGGRSAYDNGEYQVVAEPQGVGVRFGYRSEVARDFVVEVNARLPEGRDDAAVYLGVRFKSTMGNTPGGYVRLIVGPNQRRAVLGVNTWDGSSWSSPRLAEASDISAINRGSETNRLGLKVKGTSFVAYVNGTEVLAAEDGTYPDGGGLVLGVIGPRGTATEARFDDLVVSELAAE